MIHTAIEIPCKKEQSETHEMSIVYIDTQHRLIAECGSCGLVLETQIHPKDFQTVIEDLGLDV